MKRNTKKFLALFLAVAMTVTPVTSLRAEEAAVQEMTEATGTEALQTEPVQGSEPEETKPQEETPVVADDTGRVSQETMQVGAEVQTGNVYTASVQANETAGQTTAPQTIQENSEVVPGTNLLASDGSGIVYADGQYNAKVDSTMGMFKIAENPAPTAIVNGDKVTVTFATAKNTYDKIYFGDYGNESEEDAVKGSLNSDGTYDFTIELSQSNLGKALSFVAGKPGGEWGSKAYTLTFTISKNGETSDTEDGTGSDTDPGTDTENESGTGDGTTTTPGQDTLEAGQYNVSVESSSSMFKVVGCVLNSTDGVMSAIITLSGKGYDYLYMGTAEEAGNADESIWIPFVKDAEGNYTYKIPVSALDTPIAVAAHSIGKNLWYDRTLTFKSEGIEKISDSGTDDTPGGNTGNTGNIGNAGNTGTQPGTPSIDATPDSESKYESDLSGSTGKVNNATNLKDGVYTPDRFLWSGGSGRVNITCTKVTVTNGQAYATIVFSSSNYSYVKANGNTYYPTIAGGSSSFTIPIELNKNNQIIGMTTAMSMPHEVTYSIFVYLAAAAAADGKNVSGIGIGSSKTLDEEAPDILGLEYEDEVVLDYAQYFKIYKYEQGITLLEIDMVTDTAREDMDDSTEEESDESKNTAADRSDDANTEDADTEDVDTDDIDTTVEISEEEGSASEVQTQEDIVAELYKENIVKYLIVPEDVEIPAGLDKEVIVIQQPADKAYAAAEDILGKMEQMDALDQIAAVACEKEDCTIDSIAEAMEEEKIVYAGTFDEPDYKELISSKCNLAVLPNEILPQEEDAEKKEEETDEDELSVEEQIERLFEMTEKYALLNIPVIVDRAQDEEEELAQKEWVKVYGVLFGCEEKAAEIFEAAVAAEE